MNNYIFIAALLCFLLGIAHSILGEYLIFNNRRKRGSLVPSKGSSELKERHLRIIWATWHLATIFGWGFGVLLLQIAYQNHESSFFEQFIQPIYFTMFAGGLLVLIATKGKHPGWIVLFLIAVLLLLGIESF